MLVPTMRKDRRRGRGDWDKETQVHEAEGEHAPGASTTQRWRTQKAGAEGNCTPGSAILKDEAGFQRKYQAGRLLGKGSYGEVWSCTERATGCEFAVKVLTRSDISSAKAQRTAQREAEVMHRLSKVKFPGIVSLHQAFNVSPASQEGHIEDVVAGAGDAHGSVGSSIVLVMDLCPAGDLFRLLSSRGRLPERSAQVLFRQLASAVAFCHSKGVVHRDIKPENILLDGQVDALYAPRTNAKGRMPHVQAKLADFGLSAILAPGESLKGYTGSKFYTAPEMLLKQSYGTRVDVWSLGVVLCTMLTGRLPFAGRNRDDIVGLRQAIIRARVSFGDSSWEGVSESARDLVLRLLEKDPRKRATAIEALAHPWCDSTAMSKPQPMEFARRPSTAAPRSLAVPRLQLHKDWSVDSSGVHKADHVRAPTPLATGKRTSECQHGSVFAKSNSPRRSPGVVFLGSGTAPSTPLGMPQAPRSSSICKSFDGFEPVGTLGCRPSTPLIYQREPRRLANRSATPPNPSASPLRSFFRSPNAWPWLGSKPSLAKRDSEGVTFFKSPDNLECHSKFCSPPNNLNNSWVPAETNLPFSPFGKEGDVFLGPQVSKHQDIASGVQPVPKASTKDGQPRPRHSLFRWPGVWHRQLHNLHSPTDRPVEISTPC